MASPRRGCPDAGGTKASLFATIGPNVAGGVVLSGHSDVVPATGQAWTSDPYALTRRGDRLYGRGTTDMKSFVAIALSLVPEMLAAKLKRPIHIALSYDEEVGCLGAPDMIARMMQVVAPPSAVIVGEPTGMAVVSGHKGVLKMTTRVRGKAVHSSVVDQGVSAVAIAARLAVWLDDRMARNRDHGLQDMRFSPSYTTLHSGILEGRNGVQHHRRGCPSRLRHPSASQRILGPTISPNTPLSPKRWQRRCGRSIRVRASTYRSSATCRVAGASRTGWPRPSPAGCRMPPAPQAGDQVVAYGTEAGQFQAAGLSTVVCGPGNMDQGHKPDEYIELSQVEAGAAFQRRLIAELSA